MKTLIISPQAGMCNRFRALCSAILIGKLSDRSVFHNWTVEPARNDDLATIRQMRNASMDTFFKPTEAIPYLALDERSSVDAVFSEWKEGSYWFARQSSAIRRCAYDGAIAVERRSADAILDCDADTVLLESSRALKPSIMNDEEYDAALGEIYAAHFEPWERHREIANDFGGGAPFVGLHIRRTDHLTHVPGARIPVRDWVKLVSRHTADREKIYICSDDRPFANRIVNALPDRNFLALGSDHDADPAREAFLEFLCLSGATRIYGTAGSSFSKEAGRFGGAPVKICAADPPGPLGKLASLAGLGRHDEPAIRFVAS